MGNEQKEKEKTLITMDTRDQEVVDGIADNIVDAFKKIMRPTDATGEVQPMGTVEIKLSKETKMYLGGLAVSAIILGAIANKVIQPTKK